LTKYSFICFPTPPTAWAFTLFYRGGVGGMFYPILPPTHRLV